MATNNHKIEIKDLKHIYLDLEQGKHCAALNGVNLTIKENRFVAVLGPSGCGKSTLLKIIAGLIKPYSGQVLLDGKPVTGPGADRGVVFQEYALLPWKNVFQNVEMGLRIKGVPKDVRREKVFRALQLVGLADVGDKFPHELSGGMKQRVAVARVIGNEPEVMLMDEPFAAVDAQTRLTLQEEMNNIVQHTSQTVFFVTHSVDEAIFLGDQVVVLTANGTVKEVIDVKIPRECRKWAELSGEQKSEYDQLVQYALTSVRAESGKKRDPLVSFDLNEKGVSV
jgi:NitT/TauT family transport system ATP-binding protein